MRTDKHGEYIELLVAALLILGFAYAALVEQYTIESELLRNIVIVAVLVLFGDVGRKVLR